MVDDQRRSHRPFAQRALSAVAEVRKEEVVTALLMFSYSFLAMTSYNIVKPITRSKFISDLGADNLPYVLLAVGLLIGVVMTGYAWISSRLPRPWGLPITQAGLVVLLLIFWVLFQTPAPWISVAFFFAGKVLGLLLISQFWTLANLVYDPRQAKRLFGFIGGGAPFGGIAGSVVITGYAARIGTTNLLLYSAGTLTLALGVVILIIRRERPPARDPATPSRSGVDALRFLREVKHLRVIALVIGLAAVGAAIIDQQLSMAASASKGREATDAITVFLGQVQLWTSLIGFVIQVWLTSRMHRLLGIGFALMVLPASLGATATLILLNGALWVPALSRVTDQALRYTVDKTTREILFLPLPEDLKYTVKSFVDVTVDRVAQGAAALLLLVLIKPWGFGLGWQSLGFASLVVACVWMVAALRAKRGYLATFRQSIERQGIQPGAVRLTVADLSTVEALMDELASPDERRVLYAIDVLESLEKHNLVTPLLLHHDSAAVRQRALAAMGAGRSTGGRQWIPAVRRLLADDSGDVRAAALATLAALQGRDAADIIRPYLEADDPRLVATAATVLIQTAEPADRSAAERALTTLVHDPSALARREGAAALGRVSNDDLRPLLMSLLYDADHGVAAEAMRSVRAVATADFRFVPTLVSLLPHRQLKGSARAVLIGYGQPVLETLAHFLHDPDEDIWVRRQVPATIAHVPSQRAMDILVSALADDDGFLRFTVISALGKLNHEHPEFAFDRVPVEKLVLREALRFYNYSSLHHNLFVCAGLSAEALLARSLGEKIARSKDRIYRLLGLLYPWRDVAAARWALERGDAKARSDAAEYMDNLLLGKIRHRLMPIVEALPDEQRVRKGNVFLKTRPRDVEETLLQLINDDDPVVAAAAINMVQERQLWSLAEDVEFVLAHRTVEDWHVFEAASWTLARHRLSEERRRASWVEPLPTIELADRIRRLPMFDAVWVDELVRIVDSGQQVRHERGRILYQEGAVPDGFEFLLDGRVTAQRGDADARTIDPPAPIAFEEVLEGLPMSETVRTVEPCVSLALSTDVCRSLLAESTDLVQGLFRMLMQRRPRLGQDLVVRGAASEPLDVPTAGGLTSIEKVLVVERIQPFSRVTPDVLLPLGSIAREVQMMAGARLFGPSDPPALWVIVAGTVSLEVAGKPPVEARAGDAVGIYETLAGGSVGCQARVTDPGVALSVDREDLFDLLSLRSDLLQQLFRALLASSRDSSSAP